MSSRTLTAMILALSAFGHGALGDVVLEANVTLSNLDADWAKEIRLSQELVDLSLSAGAFGNDTIDKISLSCPGRESGYTRDFVKIVIGETDWYQNNGYRPQRLGAYLLTPPYRGKTYRLYDRGGDRVDVTLVDFSGDRNGGMRYIRFHIVARAADKLDAPSLHPPDTHSLNRRNCKACGHLPNKSDKFCGRCGDAILRNAKASPRSGALPTGIIYDRVLVFDGSLARFELPEARVRFRTPSQAFEFSIQPIGGHSRRDDFQATRFNFYLNSRRYLTLEADKVNKPVGSQSLHDFLGGRVLETLGPITVGIEILAFDLVEREFRSRANSNYRGTERLCSRMVCRVIAVGPGGAIASEFHRGPQSLATSDYYRRYPASFCQAYETRCRRNGVHWSPPKRQAGVAPRDYVQSLRSRGFWGMVDDMFEDAARIGSWTQP